MAGRYSDEEVRAILGRALEQDALGADGFDHEDLVAAAAEVGIDAAAVERAAAELSIEREARDNVLAHRRKKRRKWFRGLLTFGIVNAFLFAVDFLTPGGPWFYWPLLGWGLLVALNGLKVLPPLSADAERDEIAKEKARLIRVRQKEAERRAREAARRAKGQTNFEETVERGVAALLGAIATHVERAASQAGREIEEQARARGPTGFERYVDDERKKARGVAEKAKRRSDRPAQSATRAGGASEPVVTPPPRARVDASDDADEAGEEESVEQAARRRDRGRGRGRA